MSTIFPWTLERGDYFVRWLIWFVTVLVTPLIVLPLVKSGVCPEGLFVVVIMLIFLSRFPCADIPRLRSLGWSPWTVVFFLVPLVNLFIQFQLFFKRGEDSDAS